MEEAVYCNSCGRKIRRNFGTVREGILTVEQEWGYFSGKDGERHSFCLCETCYDKIIQSFLIPVRVEEYL